MNEVVEPNSKRKSHMKDNLNGRGIVDDALARVNWAGIEHLLPSSYDVVDFFSGCGGLSYGFHEIAKITRAFRPVGAFDIDRHANRTYLRNFGMDASDLDLGTATIGRINRVLEMHGRAKDKPLIVVGGPPCQGFSSHRKKDPREDGRNSLVGRFAEIAVGLHAELVVLENVPDLLAEKHWRHYEAFIAKLGRHGYNITAKIVNMAEYGVPQERFRTVVIAAKNFIPTLPEPVLSRSSFVTVRDAIGWLPPLAAGQGSSDDPMHLTSKHRRETVNILRHVPKNGGSRPVGIGPACLDRVKGFYDVYGRLYWDKPAVTITARCRTPSCGRFAHPEQDRGLSVREAALLQGFPPDYFFEGPFDDKFKQIGNAVPPRFSIYLAAHILAMLSGQYRGSKETHETIRGPLFKSYSIKIAHIKQQGNSRLNGKS